MIPFQHLLCGIIRLKKLINFMYSTHVSVVVYHTDWLLGYSMVSSRDINLSGLLIMNSHQHMKILEIQSVFSQ